MKKKFSQLFSQSFVTLFVLALVNPGLVFAQQKPQGSSSTDSTASGKPVSGAPSAVRRNGRARGVSPIEEDFQEALRLVEDHYVEGSKLDYNAVFKSSITGMLRSLDPHSNYFDKEEFDELKTDQRSEYFGIGASIQNLRHRRRRRHFHYGYLRKFARGARRTCASVIELSP